MLSNVFGRKRHVRVHLRGAPTIEGIQLGRRPVSGHYVLLMPKVHESADDSTSIEGRAEIPQGQVIFIQVLTAAVV